MRTADSDRHDRKRCVYSLHLNLLSWTGPSFVEIRWTHAYACTTFYSFSSLTISDYADDVGDDCRDEDDDNGDHCYYPTNISRYGRWSKGPDLVRYRRHSIICGAATNLPLCHSTELHCSRRGTIVDGETASLRRWEMAGRAWRPVIEYTGAERVIAV